MERELSWRVPEVERVFSQITRPQACLEGHLQRVRKWAFEEGWKAGLAEGAAKLGWDQQETAPGLHRSMDHVR